ncbi:hypothetical protein KA057_01985 [Candidatus Gracilibacteria bacterium]|nr:hypothetical protein [Candidatus Gracilibacteria bacterium]
MKKVLSIFLLVAVIFPLVGVNAIEKEKTSIAESISTYNQIAEQYNATGNDRAPTKRRVLLNLRAFVNKVLSKEAKMEFKKQGYRLTLIPVKGKIPLIAIGSGAIGRSQLSNSLRNNTTTQGTLNITEKSFIRVSEEFDFKVYEAEVKAVSGDVVLEKIDLVQFGSGEGINIGELYKRDYNGVLLTLTNSRDERVYNYHKRDGNPGISFDLFTGLNPGMKIKNGETVKFTIKVESIGFSEGKDFQRTNTFFAKYKISGQSEIISGTTPQIIAYSICDEGVKVGSGSIPIVFDQYMNRNLFRKTVISLYTRNLETDRRLPNESEYKIWKNTFEEKEFGSDYKAYQSDISEGTASGSTYDSWLKLKYIQRLIDSYEDRNIPWVFYGYQSQKTPQFAPPNGMQCGKIEELATIQRENFKDKYLELRSANEKQQLIDSVNSLNARISELQRQVDSLK